MVPSPKQDILLDLIFEALLNLYIKKIAQMKKGGSTLSKAQNDMVDDFCGITNASKKQAQEFLKKSNWNVQNSLNEFFNSGIQPEVEKAQNAPQIDLSFEKFSKEHNGQRIMDEELFGQFVQEYLKLEGDDVVLGHILINIMQLQTPGIITKQNFYKLFNYCKCTKPKDLAAQMPKLHKELITNTHLYKNMYIQIYQFYLTGKEILLDFEIAEQLWEIYLKPIMSFYKEFMNYLKQLEKKPHKVHKDLWRMVYEFSITVKKLDQYSESDAYPVLLDNFVEYIRNGGK